MAVEAVVTQRERDHTQPETNETQHETRVDAVMFTDIVGYSRMMRENARRTLRLREEHERCMMEWLQACHPRIIKNTGDGFLVVFGSSRQAKIQEGEVFCELTDSTSLQESRLACARLSLEGLSTGDAFGQQFFMNEDRADRLIADRVLPSAPWMYTDDTEMALSVVTVLRDYGEIDQDTLAERFAMHYDIRRGYGPNMHSLLARIREGELWSVAAASLFGGQGSHGNGAAMRVAPVGAYFADDLKAVVEQARLSAEVTHTHPEGIAGAIAVAVAAAWAWRWRGETPVPSQRAFLDTILRSVPDSVVYERIRHARNLAPDASVRLAVSALGNGVGLSRAGHGSFRIVVRRPSSQ